MLSAEVLKAGGCEQKVECRCAALSLGQQHSTGFSELPSCDGGHERAPLQLQEARIDHRRATLTGCTQETA